MAKMTIKQRAIRDFGWTSAQYDKIYDKLRNRVRAFEKGTGASIKSNVAMTLYFTEKELQSAGSSLTLKKPNYNVLSLKRATILQTPSISSGKTISGNNKTLANFLSQKFGGLAEKARESYERVMQTGTDAEKARAQTESFWAIYNNPTLTIKEKLKKLSEIANGTRARLTEMGEYTDDVTYEDADYYDVLY